MVEEDSCLEDSSRQVNMARWKPKGQARGGGGVGEEEGFQQMSDEWRTRKRRGGGGMYWNSAQG
jgi:hypothetical protein